jgi:hypothetical protein
MARKDRSRIGRGAPSIAGALLAAAALAGGGCAAGTHATDPVPVPEDEAQVIARADAEATREASLEARDIERRLLLRDDGRTLVHAMRAHGGHDRWRLAGPVSYARVRSERGDPAAGEAHAAPSSTGPEPSIPDPPPRVTRETIRLMAPRGDGPPPPGAGVLDLEDEQVILDLPFLLVGEDLRREYAGVELDLRTGDFLEQIRVLREGSTADAWIVVSFDRSTSILRRILWKRTDGKMWLVALSDWREVGGILVAARRDTHFLDGPHGHWDPAKPDRTDRLEDLLR